MGEKETEREAERLRKAYTELQRKRNRFNFSIPYKIRFPLAWTLFFAVVGIIQQSIISKALVFIDFFGRNYVDWFASFGNFSESYKVLSNQDFFLMILGHWYYFFFTGGILSIIWAIVYMLTHVELKMKKDDFTAGSI